MKSLTQISKEVVTTMVVFPHSLEVAKAESDREKSGPTNTVTSAENECHQDGMAVKNTVAMPAGTLPTNSDNGTGKRQGDVSQWVTSPPPNPPYRFPVLETAVCEHCGAEMPVKRNAGAKRKRFCSGACRVAAYRQRRQAAAGEAGGGKVIVFLILALLVAIWFVWPSIQAARVSLAGQAARLTVNQVQPMGETAVSLPGLVATVGAMAAPETAVTNQAAPELPQVAATAVPPRVDVAATAGASMLHITANGREYNLTGEQLVDCVNAQQNGRRTGPSCPPSASNYLGMLGQGR